MGLENGLDSILSKMPSKLTSEFVESALLEKVWDVGNRVIYDMCAANREHVRDDVIIAKIWLIGRTYAAAIERRRDKGDAIGDAFYETKVGPQIRDSDIDKWFEALDNGSNEDMALNLETHKRVLDLFTKISGLEKRSLASKYLHFHFPLRFYIYDSRACTVISALTKPIGKRLPSLREHDDVYARFSLRCRDLNERIDSLAGRHLSTREFDKVLLAYSRP
jgi:hypothetical protein